jgi:hypothetical protein
MLATPRTAPGSDKEMGRSLAAVAAAGSAGGKRQGAPLRCGCRRHPLVALNWRRLLQHVEQLQASGLAAL